MRLDISPRCSGKTTRMIEWLGENNRHILIVHSISYRDNLRYHHHDLKDRILAASEDIGLKTSHESILGFDDLDMILLCMYRRQIEVASITSTKQGYHETKEAWILCMFKLKEFMSLKEFRRRARISTDFWDKDEDD